MKNIGKGWVAENKIKYGIKGECQNAKLDKKKTRKWSGSSRTNNSTKGMVGAKEERRDIEWDMTTILEDIVRI